MLHALSPPSATRYALGFTNSKQLYSACNFHLTTLSSVLAYQQGKYPVYFTVNITELFTHARTVYPRRSFPLFSRVHGNEAKGLSLMQYSPLSRFMHSC